MLALLRRLLADHGQNFIPSYLMAFACMALVAGCTSLSAWLMRDVINLIFVAQDRAALLYIPALIIAVFAIKGVATYGQERTLGRVANCLVASTQARIFDHLSRMEVAFYQRHPSNDLITRIAHNAMAVRDMLNVSAVAVGRDLLTVIGLTTVMVLQDPILCAMSLLVAPVAVFGIRKLVRRVRGAARAEIESSAELVAAVRETTQGIRIVKAFQLEPLLRRQARNAIAEIERLANRIVRAQARVSPLLDTLAGITTALVVLYAGWRNLSYGETPGQFFAFITALFLVADPVRRLSRVPLQLARAAVGVRMMHELVGTEPADRDAPGAVPLDVRSAEVRFERVSFAYQRSATVLRELSLIAPAGKTTALVGLSGAGKSTILSLLQRFWTPQAGSILIDDQPIAAVTLASLRRSIAFVSQDAFLLEGTIEENIRAGQSQTSHEAVAAAARAAQAHDFIVALPNGYQTRVGELGSLVSGGERQRIAIARAILKNAPIVLLDEPTSALDSETEDTIQQALRELMRGKTTIVIAHRLATILHADMIHVIDHGRVAESGTHPELLKKGGAYARLHRLQFRDRACGELSESKGDSTANLAGARR